MGVPESVQKQADRAEEIQKQIIPGQNLPAAPAAPVNTPPVVPAATPAEPVPATPPGPVPVTLPVATVVDPTPAPVTPTPAEPIIPVPAKCENCSKLEHKYSVLQGKYDKEVPRLTYRIAFLENQIDEAKRQIDAKPNDPAAAPSPAASPAPGSAIGEMLRNSTDEKVKTFRENFPDMFEFVANAADMIAGKTIQQTEKRLEGVEQRNAVSAQEKFVAELASKVPGWQKLCQEDPNWPVFLNGSEIYSGKKKLDLLKEASQSWNASVVVNLLKDFQKEFNVGNAPLPNPSTPTPPTPPAPVFPPSGPSSAPALPGGAQPEYFTRSSINQFYQAVRRGEYCGREKEQQDIDARIMAATAKGMIVDR